MNMLPIQLLLREIYILWENLNELLPEPAFPLLLVLHFQIPEVNLGIKLLHDAIKEGVDPQFQRMLELILVLATPASHDLPL